MNGDQSPGPLIAYLSTLGAIVFLTIAAAVITISIDDQENLPQIVAALAFIGAATTGLVGVIGTFRPKALPKEPEQLEKRSDAPSPADEDAEPEKVDAR